MRTKEWGKKLIITIVVCESIFFFGTKAKFSEKLLEQKKKRREERITEGRDHFDEIPIL